VSELTIPELMRIAERVCTQAELAALRARAELTAEGKPDGHRSVAAALGVGRSTARDLLISAAEKIGRTTTRGRS
jgi:hypothetical protein